MSICLNSSYLEGFILKHELSEIFPMVESAHKLLTTRSGAGGEFLGWLDLPLEYDRNEFDRLKTKQKFLFQSELAVHILVLGRLLKP